MSGRSACCCSVSLSLLKSLLLGGAERNRNIIQRRPRPGEGYTVRTWDASCFRLAGMNVFRRCTDASKVHLTCALVASPFHGPPSATGTAAWLWCYIGSGVQLLHLAPLLHHSRCPWKQGRWLAQSQ